MDSALRITEIFYSLQGESTLAGLPTVFIRLTGCPLRCVYCDTAYAFEGGERQEISSILKEVSAHQTRYVTVTGGEPLAQPNVLPLMRVLADEGYTVSLETSGALPIDQVDPRVIRVMDLKTPSSGELARNLETNIPHLAQKDQVKFVIKTREDFDWSVSKMLQYNLAERVGCCLFSPVHGELRPAELAEWMLAENVPGRLQVQLHKILWGERQGV